MNVPLSPPPPPPPLNATLFFPDDFKVIPDSNAGHTAINAEEEDDVPLEHAQTPQSPTTTTTSSVITVAQLPSQRTDPICIPATPPQTDAVQNHYRSRSRSRSSSPIRHHHERARSRSRSRSHSPSSVIHEELITDVLLPPPAPLRQSPSKPLTTVAVAAPAPNANMQTLQRYYTKCEARRKAYHELRTRRLAAPHGSEEWKSLSKDEFVCEANYLKTRLDILAVRRFAFDAKYLF